MIPILHNIFIHPAAASASRFPQITHFTFKNRHKLRSGLFLLPNLHHLPFVFAELVYTRPLLSCKPKAIFTASLPSGDIINNIKFGPGTYKSVGKYQDGERFSVDTFSAIITLPTLLCLCSYVHRRP